MYNLKNNTYSCTNVSTTLLNNVIREIIKSIFFNLKLIVMKHSTQEVEKTQQKN